MKSRFLFLLFLCSSTVALAQSKISSLGRFEMDEVSGCAPLTVKITSTDLNPSYSCESGQPGFPCDMDWGDGTPIIQSDFSHTYTQSGTYQIAINYQGVGYDYIEIVVFPYIEPTFNVYTCSGNEVQVQVTDTNYDSYFIAFGDGSAEVEVLKGSLPVTHNYGPGPHPPMSMYEVQVRGKNTGAADNCNPPAEREVQVSADVPEAPTIDQLIISNSSTIDLEMTTKQNVLYRLEVAANGGTFQNLGNLYNVNTVTIPDLDTDVNFYCFRVGATDPCAGGTPAYSPVICSAVLAVSAQNNANSLTWTTSTTDVASFTIKKDGTPLTPTTLLTTFIDTNVECGTEYCYEIITNYAYATSISATRCVTAISTDIPTAIANVSSVVNESSVELTWQPDAVFQAETYLVLRQANGGSFNPLESGITPASFTDTDYQIANQNCYRVDYTDVCGNTSDPGISACPVILSYSTNSNNEIILTWSAYTGWTAGVDHYELDKYDLQHNGPETFNLGTALTYTDTDLTDQGYYYVVRAIPNDAANDESVSNEVEAIRSLRFAYPKAFTPDKQGPTENETFKVFVTEEFIASFDMKVFNRWGEMIYSTTDLLKGWDGKYNGEPQPEGTYTFTATLRDKTGRTYKRDGSVMLLRKK